MPTLNQLQFLAVTTVLITLSAGCSSAKQPQATASIVTPSIATSANPASGTVEQPQANNRASPTSSKNITPVQQIADNSQSSECNRAQTQREINACASSQAQAADEKLNLVYRQLRAKLKGSTQEQQLIQAQVAWIKFRDADCKYARDQYQGGTFAPAAQAFCLARVTKQRTQDLEDYLEQASL